MTKYYKRKAEVSNDSNSVAIWTHSKVEIKQVVSFIGNFSFSIFDAMY